MTLVLKFEHVGEHTYFNRQGKRHSPHREKLLENASVFILSLIEVIVYLVVRYGSFTSIKPERGGQMLTTILDHPIEEGYLKNITRDLHRAS